MKYVIGADHSFDGILTLKNRLIQQGIDVEIYIRNNWAEVGLHIGEMVACQKYNEAILMCSSGTGMSIAANKVIGCRAALCTTKFMAETARWYNHANVLVLPSEEMDIEKSMIILDAWLNTPFGNSDVGSSIDLLWRYERE